MTTPDFIEFIEALAPEGEKVLFGKSKVLEDGTDGYVPTDTLPPNTALYANTGSFIKSRADQDGKLRAKAENIEQCLFLMLDDIGTKAKTPPVEPTWKIETSPGNYQWGYAYSQRPTKGQQSAAVRAFAAAGYSDPGASNAVRWSRIPGSLNKKKQFIAKLTEFHPERKFTLPELCAEMGVTMGEPEMERHEAKAAASADAPPIEQAVEMLKHIKADDREVYRNVGMAMQSAYDDAGRAFWLAWAKTCPEYDNPDAERDAEKDWKSFKDMPNGIGIGTLFHYAIEGGWKHPAPDVEGMFGEVEGAQQSEEKFPAPYDPSEAFLIDTFNSHGLNVAKYRSIVAPIPHPDGAFMLKMDGRVVEYHKGIGRVRASGNVSPIFFGDVTQQNFVLVTDNWFSAAALHEATGDPVICIEGWAFGEIQSEDGESSRALHTKLLEIVRPNLKMRVITTTDQEEMRLRMATFRMLMMEEGVNVIVFALPMIDFHPVDGFGDWAAKTWGSRENWPRGDDLTKALFGKGGALQRVADDDLAEAAKSYTMSNADRFGKFHLDLTDRGAGSYILSKLGRGSFYYLKDRDEWVQWHDGAWRSIGKEPLFLIDIAAHGYLQRSNALRKQVVQIEEALRTEKDPIRKAQMNIDISTKTEQAVDFHKRYKVLSMTTGRLNVLKDLKHRGEVAVFSKIFDADDWMIGVKNGILDLRTGIVREARQEDMMFRSCRSRYVKGATHPRITKLLQEITATAYLKDAPSFMGAVDGFVLDGGREQWLQRRLGAMLVGGNKLTSLEILHGFGSNGKSVLGKLLSGVLGKAGTAIGESGYLTTVPAAAIMSSYHAKDPDAATPYLATTPGARVLLMSESKDTDKINEQLVKNITGGDEVAYRGLYKGAATFRPQFTPILLTNPLPQVVEGGKAIWDRLAPMHLAMRWARPGASEEDKNTLPPEDTWFRDEADGDVEACEAFLSWLVDGCLSWQKDGLGEMPTDVRATINSYRETSDHFGAWAAENNVVFDPTSFTTSGSIFNSYSMWEKQNGKQSPSKDVVIRRLLEWKPELRKGKRDDVRGVWGINVPMFGWLKKSETGSVGEEVVSLPTTKTVAV